MSRSQAASCHSLVVRMPGPVDAEELRQRLHTAAAGARADLAGLRSRCQLAATIPATVAPAEALSTPCQSAAG
ncbi:hypothetical protein, partial [Kitasatospora sp. NPDC047058]|uniref:hypothetical protein n=1 Tax=Kitasatospora sp. NPDC047058 TaxID=3155620 RepID=UPI003411E811